MNATQITVVLTFSVLHHFATATPLIGEDRCPISELPIVNVAIHSNDEINIAVSRNHCVRKIGAKAGTVSTRGVTGEAGYRRDGGPAKRALFDFVMCIE